tara:strand:+ start:25887 stop:26465 length:579 start_codon:yes stop_codon:yes gene_type:complete
MFKSKKSTSLIILGGVIFMFGLSYASVPLYQIFCQVTGIGGTTQRVENITMSPSLDILNENKKLENNFMDNRLISVKFSSDVSNTMPWKFEPVQKEIKVLAGETALIFYKAENLTDESIIGISTYNVNPPQAGIYFNKIQCFCFEEQRLKGHESIDMPVFFYLDPEILEDPLMSDIDNITLSYTFFNVNEIN